jgi:stage V sporulation protein S
MVATQIKAAATSPLTAVAFAIAGAIRQKQPVGVRAISVEAVNKAIKAIIIARQYLEADGLDLICVPTFEVIDFEGEERTVLQLDVEACPLIPHARKPNRLG